MQVTTEPTRADTALARITIEDGLWAALLAIALLARVWMLEGMPLNNAEASVANAALSLARGGSASLTNPLHGGLQAALFALFGANEFSARLISALASAALCGAPYLMRGSLGRRTALIMGSLLVFSPTLWHVGRLSDGGSLAWLMAIGAWAAMAARRASVTGILLGLLAACGIDAAAPALALLAFALLARRIGTPLASPNLVAAAGAFGLGATLSLWNLSGLGSALQGYADFAAEMVRSGPMPLWRLMLGFGTFETLVAVGSVVELIRWRNHAAFARRHGGTADREEGARRAPWMLLAAIGLSLALVDGSRDVHHLIPLVLACAALTAMLADRALAAVAREGAWSAEGMTAGLALIFLLAADMGVRQYAGLGDSKWLMLAILAIFTIVSGGIALTLRLPVAAAMRGAGIAAWTFLAVGGFGTGFSLTQGHAANPAQPYVTEAVTAEATALKKAIEQTSTWGYGDPTVLPIEAPDNAPAWLRWLLRDQRFVSYVPRPANGAAALLPATVSFSSEYGYVANTLDVLQRSSLAAVRCREAGDRQDCQLVARWLTLREAGAPATTRWTLYVRQDIAARASGQTGMR